MGEVKPCSSSQHPPGQTFRYDQIDDIRYIDKYHPYPEKESEEIGDEIVACLNSDFGESKNLEIVFLSKRLLSISLLELPVMLASPAHKANDFAHPAQNQGLRLINNIPPKKSFYLLIGQSLC
jgi:hypothetical protein